MICELVNLSDKYFLQGEVAAACAAALLIGEGKYGLKWGPGFDEQMPSFVFGGAEEWFQGRFGRALSAYLDEHVAGAVADALDSVALAGSPDEYRAYLHDWRRTIDHGDEWRRQRHNTKRSSENNIGERAWALAQALRNKASVAATPLNTSNTLVEVKRA